MVQAGKGPALLGHQVTIACLPDSVIESKAIEAGLKIWHFTISADIEFWKIPTLINYYKNNQVDVLICCQNKDVRIGARAARKAGVKAIFARQGIQNLTNKRKYIKPFTRFIDGIITNTRSIKDIYESFGWFPPDFIHVIYNGVDVPKEMQKLDLHQLYRLPTGSRIMFSAGRLDHQKGFDLLVAVARKALDQNLNWQILIAGEGKLKHRLHI